MEGLGGDGGVEGRFLSADIALFGTGNERAVPVLVMVGEGQRLGVGDLYLELTSLVRERHVVPLFFSGGTKGGLGVSNS